MTNDNKCIVDHYIVHGRLWFNSWIHIFINIIAFTFCQAQPSLSSRFSFSLLLCEASWAWAWHSSAPACYVLNSNKIKYINIRTSICSLLLIQQKWTGQECWKFYAELLFVLNWGGAIKWKGNEVPKDVKSVFLW